MAPAALARWIRRELAAHPPRARSLIVTIWGDALAPHGGEAWLGTLIALAAPFGVNARLVRTSVFRLAHDGWIEGTARGRRSRYRLTASGAERFAQAYRRVYAPPLRAWDGAWDVAVVPQQPAAARRRLRDDLAWRGYAAFGPGVYARLSGPADDEAAAWPAGTLRVRARDLPPPGHASLAGRADAAWGLAALAVDYRAFAGRFRPLAEAAAAGAIGDPLEAFAVRTLLVHGYRRVRLRDPQLPGDLLPPGWPGHDAYALCRDLYRACEARSRDFLAAAFAAAGERLPPARPDAATRFAG